MGMNEPNLRASGLSTASAAKGYVNLRLTPPLKPCCFFLLLMRQGVLNSIHQDEVVFTPPMDMYVRYTSFVALSRIFPEPPANPGTGTRKP